MLQYTHTHYILNRHCEQKMLFKESKKIQTNKLIKCSRIWETLPLHPFLFREKQMLGSDKSTSVASMVQMADDGNFLWKSTISCSGKSPQTSAFITKNNSGPPVMIWSRKWYKPPAVPSALYSCKYLYKEQQVSRCVLSWSMNPCCSEKKISR